MLTPSGGPTSLTRKVGESIGQTSWTDVWTVLEINWDVQFQNGQIIVKSSSIVFGVNMYRCHITFDIWEEFNVMVNIPFTETNTQIIARVTVFEREKNKLISFNFPI